jgi:hypothetical protein
LVKTIQELEARITAIGERIMNFNFDGKDYNSDDLSDKGKACLNKLQDLGIKKQQLSLEIC